MKFIWNLSEVAKTIIINILRGKAGVYQWVNNTNGKTYVGSSSNLYRRFLEYMSPSFIIRELLRGNSLIYRALLKYGPASFTFKVLKFVTIVPLLSETAQNAALLEVEQEYIDLLQPEYNILKKAGSAKGHELPEETRTKMNVSKKGNLHIEREVLIQMNQNCLLKKIMQSQLKYSCII